MGRMIITHSGRAHLDDFLSCCLVINRDLECLLIHRRDPTKEEIEDPEIWKLDIGKGLRPDSKLYDHHQEDMDDCTLSLLLKDWGEWERAKITFLWLETMVMLDSRGVRKTLKHLNMPPPTLAFFDSFVERSMLRLFSKKNIIKKNTLLFKLMRFIGKMFFEEMDEYQSAINLVEKNTEFKEIQDVPVIQYIKKLTPSLDRVLREKKKAKWGYGGIVIFPNDRPMGSIAVKRYDEDERVDFRKLSESDENIIFIHKSGFFAVFKAMCDYELDQYIKGAIKKSKKG